MPDFGKALKQLRHRDRQPYLTGLSPVAAISLSTQLTFLRARTPAPARTRTIVHDILPEGDVESTPFGHHYVVRKAYGSGHYHGKVRLNRFSTAELQTLMGLMKQRASVPGLERILFLDTETTGIQGGTGICPFMVGVAFFSGEDFQVVQYFIRDFDEESSMLHALGKLLEKFDLVITYNGATFDIPLLETRFTLARFDNPFERIGHFDLLNTARRLWRNGHGSCRLTALERLLSFVRGPDVPGAMIPRVYFEFLQGGAAPELKGVFTHNVFDVASLAALTIHACDRVVSEAAVFDEPLDLYSVARILEDSAEWQRAVEFYEMALQGGLPEAFRVKALESLSVMYRRAGDHERALGICADLMRSELFSLVAYEGAAIYHERIATDMEAALRVVEAGLRRMDGGAPDKRRKSLLQSRWDRLQQKVIGFPSSATV